MIASSPMMNRRQFNLFATLVAALLMGSCAPGYTIVRQAMPNPFLGAHSFSVEPVHFETLQVGQMTEAEWLSRKTPEQQASYMADRQAMIERFVARMTARNPGIEIIAGPPAGPQTFIIRPILEFIEQGYYVFVSHRDTEARMRVQVLNQSGQVLDEFLAYTRVQADLYHPATGGRLRTAADRLSDSVTHYLRDRTGIR
ncbi:MAG: hypothetical protein WCJ30_26125 [Deltaproteobacteria bacterium]